ncbi:Hypothetical protein CAP_3376 [Chondromyces apiculatus DSM 436]|uniref:Uncharacterized protein n=1 Tax=Chondromyces apiculatus DSM 436 TaxID=1192034 RepID=A0A017T9E7_9BACT|nr:Hypothetical protein CAP_3376 [Chondromyces apiculatus DSM 436]
MQSDRSLSQLSRFVLVLDATTCKEAGAATAARGALGGAPGRSGAHRDARGRIGALGDASGRSGTHRGAQGRSGARVPGATAMRAPQAAHAPRWRTGQARTAGEMLRGMIAAPQATVEGARGGREKRPGGTCAGASPGSAAC